MDPLKNKRKQLRREFTLAADSYENAWCSKDVEQMEDTFSLLTEVADKLLQVESTLSDKWCEWENFDDEIFQKDQDKAMEYRQRFISIKNRHNKFISPTFQRYQSQTSLKSAKSEPDIEVNNAPVRSQQRKWRPRLELVKFDGNVKNWLMYWGQFKEIDEDTDLDDIDKFQYLLQSMAPDTNARKLVETYPPSGENYKKALAALKARFARNDILIETYVRGLLNIVLMQQKGQVSDLTLLYDNLQTHLQALETLGVAKDKYASVLFPMIESALPEDLLRTWNRCRISSEIENEQLTQLLLFLKREVESEERIQLARKGFQENIIPGPSQPTLSCHTTAEKKAFNLKKQENLATGPPACLWCDKSTHASSECHKAAKMTLEERNDFIKVKKACQICLKIGHLSKRCRSSVKCLFCKKRHMILLCPDLHKQSCSTPSTTTEHKSDNLLCHLKSTTLLQTLAVKLVNCDKEVSIRVLIDTGSQRSYIKKDLAVLMGLKPTKKELISHCLFGGVETDAVECQGFNVCLKSLNNDFKMQISVIEQTNICGFLPKVKSNVIIEQLRRNGITLTDASDTPNEVSILIGADYSGFLLTGDFLQLDNNLTAIRTKMGWTIQGPVTGVFSSVVRTITTLHCLTKIDLSDLWTLEALGIRDPSEQISKTAHENELLEAFNSTIKVNEENRYEVRLPWKNMLRPQPNYEIAKKRLMSTTDRLKSLGRLADYDTVIKEWLSLNIIEEAPNPKTYEGVYMPHHPVIKETSQTTKVRPVFDASAKDTNGVSLNACLEKGTNLIERIPELLIDFRKEAFGITADIAKAFLQISLDHEDRDHLKFLWWSDINSDDKRITTFRHRRVVFGVTSSPFHLAATISYHLDHAPVHLKETATKLKKSFYVDNCVTSVSSTKEMHTFISEAKELMSSGMFDLRCWVTAPERIDENIEFVSVLGVIWNTKYDNISCNVSSNLDTRSKITKRSLLSVAQKIFDPIGLCSPTTIIPKMIMQKSWERKLTWDEELPSDLSTEFKRWTKDLHLIPEIKIPRRLSRFDISKSINSVHVFCDASLHAYSACLFLRTAFQQDVDVKLIMAKSRVTPVKKVTIPRLELIAATLATRLTKMVLDSLNLPACDVHYWTDSSVVLSWIKGDGDWNTFVANRVREIRNMTSRGAWKHVPGELNPADPSSRGVSVSKLLESRWWEGPNWLYQDPADWPNTDFIVSSKLVDEERKHSTKSMLIEEGSSVLDKFTYFSKYIKTVRTISWMMRFGCPKKRQKMHGELTYEEIEDAERKLIRLIQQKHKNKLKKLQTFIDDDGIVRLETKLNLGGESYDFKAPIVLPACEIIVERLVAERHVVLQHAGTQTLMANLRETFWIIGIRKLVKRVVRDCKICRRLSAKACNTPMASLPTDRTESSTAFEVSGVDLAGPLLLKSGTKCWIVLFTCATFRAIHLEVVESLSANDFIQALRRFIARRGRVKCIYSDNATNFIGVSNSLKAIDWNKVLCW